MNDIIKLWKLVENGYVIKGVNSLSSGKGVITLTFGGNGNPIEGQIYFLITEDQTVIERAKEQMK